MKVIFNFRKVKDKAIAVNPMTTVRASKTNELCLLNL